MRGPGGAAACKAAGGVLPPGNPFPPPPAPGSSPEETPAYNESSDGRRSSGVKKHHHKHNLKHRYELLETLGRGTYGKVKKAIERHSGREVSHSATTTKVFLLFCFFGEAQTLWSQMVCCTQRVCSGNPPPLPPPCSKMRPMGPLELCCTRFVLCRASRPDAGVQIRQTDRQM